MSQAVNPNVQDVKTNQIETEVFEFEMADMGRIAAAEDVGSCTCVCMCGSCICGCVVPVE